MIRQTTTIPLTDVDQSDEPRSDWARWTFVMLEVVLLGSIPVLAMLGFRGLLDSRAGQFTAEPGPEDPGWLALVEPTPIRSIVDVDEGRVGGIVLVVPTGEALGGGTVILVSGATEIDGVPLAERGADGAVAALAASLRLAIDPPILADGDGWAELLGEVEIELANPDPVPGVDGAIAVAAGRVTVGAADLPALSSRLPVGVDDPDALEFRREVLWRTMLDEAVFVESDPPSASVVDDTAIVETAVERVRRDLAAISVGLNRVEQLPLAGRTIDAEAAEALVRSSVARPLGHEPGARLQVRVIDRSGSNDLETAARNLGQAGFEVVQIGNASVLDDGPTQLFAPAGADAGEVARLAEVSDAATVPPSLDPEAVSTVTLLLGVRSPIAVSS